jgi:hypothetical protein
VVLELFTTYLLCNTGTHCSRAFLLYEKVEREWNLEELFDLFEWHSSSTPSYFMGDWPILDWVIDVPFHKGVLA